MHCIINTIFSVSSLLMGVLFLSSCGGGSSSTSQEFDLFTYAGPDQSVIIGNSSNLMAQGYTVSESLESSSLTYRWKLITAPPGSDVTLPETSGNSISFTPDVEGKYLIGVDFQTSNRTSLMDTVAIIVSSVKIRKLNDTGLVHSVNLIEGGMFKCGDNQQYEDCAVGRDFELNDNTDGAAGFSFTKLDSQGNALHPTSAVWSCVQDNVSGLVWEVKTNDGGVRDASKKYIGGHSGWGDLVSAANIESLCGFNDWRVPSLFEAKSIINYGSYGPALDVNYFANLKSLRNHWTSSTARMHNGLWQISFNDGRAERYSSTYEFHVMLVRGDM